MNICIYDIPSLFVLGMILGRLDAKYWRLNSPMVYPFMAAAVYLLFTVDAVLAAVGVIGAPWGMSCPCCSEKVSIPLGIILILSYPLWFAYGAELMRIFFGRRPYEGGLVWPLTLNDKTSKFPKPWDQGTC
jgi:hypothetical protein